MFTKSESQDCWILICAKTERTSSTESLLSDQLECSCRGRAHDYKLRPRSNPSSATEKLNLSKSLKLYALGLLSVK